MTGENPAWARVRKLLAQPTLPGVRNDAPLRDLAHRDTAVRELLLEFGIEHALATVAAHGEHEILERGERHLKAALDRLYAAHPDATEEEAIEVLMAVAERSRPLARVLLRAGVQARVAEDLERIGFGRP